MYKCYKRTAILATRPLYWAYFGQQQETKQHFKTAFTFSHQIRATVKVNNSRRTFTFSILQLHYSGPTPPCQQQFIVNTTPRWQQRVQACGSLVEETTHVRAIDYS